MQPNGILLKVHLNEYPPEGKILKVFSKYSWLIGSLFVTGFSSFLFKASTRQDTFLSSEGDVEAESCFKLKYLMAAWAIKTDLRPFSATLIR